MRIECLVDAGSTPTSVSFTWQQHKNDSVVINLPATDAFLVLEDVSSSDAGFYTCRVQTAGGAAEASARLSVYGKRSTGSIVNIGSCMSTCYSCPLSSQSEHALP